MRTEKWKNRHDETNSCFRNFANTAESARLAKNWTQANPGTQWATLPLCYPYKQITNYVHIAK
jgi:hypothetical protein